MRKYSFFWFLLLIFIFPIVTGAQLNVPQNAQLATSPRYPSAGEEVTVELSAYTYDTTGASITWKVNGTIVEGFSNQRIIQIEVGELGEATSVEALVTLKNGQVISTQKTITPGQLDIIIDANTLVPEFYQGRPLPSNGSTVQIVAIPSFGDGRGVNEFSYTWQLNNKVLFGGSTQGRYIARFTMPMGKNANISVDVSDASGQVVISKSISIPIATPEIIFYPDNPLRGLSMISTGNIYKLVGDEVTVRAEPYYMDKDILEKNVLLEWSIDGKTTENPNLDQQNIVLQNGGGSGLFDIEFHIRNLSELLQGAYGNFKMSF